MCYHVAYGFTTSREGGRRRSPSRDIHQASASPWGKEKHILRLPDSLILSFPRVEVCAFGKRCPRTVWRWWPFLPLFQVSALRLCHSLFYPNLEVVTGNRPTGHVAGHCGYNGEGRGEQPGTGERTSRSQMVGAGGPERSIRHVRHSE